MIPTLRPEDELILRWAANSAGDQNDDRICALIRQGIDWKFVLKRAKRHKLPSLLYGTLRPKFRADLPGIFLNQLRSHYSSNVVRNTLMTRELIRIMGLLKAGGIPAIAFKGTVLASSLYGDLALRQCDDLDLLISRSSIMKAKALLVEDGYQLVLPVPARLEAFFLRSHYEHAFTSPDQKFAIELHWALTFSYCSFSMDTDPLWQRSRDVFVEGTAVRTFCPEDLLLILCEHACKHCWERLSWIIDVARLVSTIPELSLPRIVERSEIHNHKIMVLLGLYLAADLLQTPLPEHLLNELRRDARVRSLATQVYQQLFSERDLPEEDSLPATDSFYMETMSRRGDRYKTLMATFFIPTSIELNQLPLPPFFLFLHCIYRPLRLLARHAATIGNYCLHFTERVLKRVKK